MRVLMMATGEFALPTFQTLIASAHDVVGLVTQPDRVGKGHHHHVNPLKELAQSSDVTVFQPANANDEAALSRLKEFEAEAFVVAAYGQILSAELLAIPPRGAVNLHASLLPLYRGAAPIQYAIWQGETETGVTIFQIEPRLDAGPILGVVKTPIDEQETSGELHDRLAELAAPLTVQVLSDMESGTLQPVSQETEGVTRAPRIKKQQGQIDWKRTSQEIGWHVRAMQPWPMPFSFLQLPGRAAIRMLILEVEAASAPSSDAEMQSPPGTVLSASDESLTVRTGDGAVSIRRLQPAGKRAMTAAEFLRGTPVHEARFADNAD